jgi:hypothetical protein
MPTPEVVDGYRGVRAEREASAVRGSGPAPAAIPAGKVTFQFKTVRYRLQLTAPVEARLTDGRIISGGRALFVQADQGFKTLDEVKDAETIRMVREHPYFGVDFWDFATVLEKGEKARREQALDVLKDPKQRALVIERLRELQESGDADFTLPAGHPQAAASE